MKQIISFVIIVLFSAALQGCRSQGELFPAGTESKNIGMEGYVMYGKIHTADSSTGTPVGKIIVGRVNYKSRKVGIPADQKVPVTGNFRSVQTKSFFGTEEHIVEYDFTAGSETEAAAVSAKLEKVKEELLNNPPAK